MCWWLAANSFTGSVVQADYTQTAARAMIMPNGLLSYRRTMTGAELKDTLRAFVEGGEGGFTPFNRGSLPVVSGIAVQVKENGGRYNDVVMKTVDDSAFGGAASTYVIYPDGRVVVENIAEDAESIYNLLAVLREYSDFTEVQMQDIANDFAKGVGGNREVTLGGIKYYLVYESTGLQNWSLVGLVPVDVINVGMNQLWLRTVQIIAGIAGGLARHADDRNRAETGEGGARRIAPKCRRLQGQAYPACRG